MFAFNLFASGMVRSSLGTDKQSVLGDYVRRGIEHGLYKLIIFEFWSNSLLCIFTARCYAYAVLAVGRCLCLSQVGVLLKWLNVGSHKQHHTIAQGL